MEDVILRTACPKPRFVKSTTGQPATESKFVKIHAPFHISHADFNKGYAIQKSRTMGAGTAKERKEEIKLISHGSPLFGVTCWRSICSLRLRDVLVRPSLSLSSAKSAKPNAPASTS